MIAEGKEEVGIVFVHILTRFIYVKSMLCFSSLLDNTLSNLTSIQLSHNGLHRETSLFFCKQMVTIPFTHVSFEQLKTSLSLVFLSFYIFRSKGYFLHHRDL